MTHSLFVFLVMTLSETQASVQDAKSAYISDAKSAHISATGRVYDAKPHSFSSRTMRDVRETDGGVSALLDSSASALLQVDGSMVAMDQSLWTSPGAFEQFKQKYHRTYPAGSEEHDMR